MFVVANLNPEMVRQTCDEWVGAADALVEVITAQDPKIPDADLSVNLREAYVNLLLATQRTSIATKGLFIHIPSENRPSVLMQWLGESMMDLEQTKRALKKAKQGGADSVAAFNAASVRDFRKRFMVFQVVTCNAMVGKLSLETHGYGDCAARIGDSPERLQGAFRRFGSVLAPQTLQ